MTIDKNTVLGQSYLELIYFDEYYFDSLTKNKLGEYLYSVNVINLAFIEFNSIIFQL